MYCRMGANGGMKEPLRMKERNKKKTEKERQSERTGREREGGT